MAEEKLNDDLDIDWDLIAKGRDRGGKPTQLSAEEKELRKEHWIRLKIELENRGIFSTPWQAFHNGEMPEELSRPLQAALDRTRQDEYRRVPPPKLGWPDWAKVGATVEGAGRWRAGMVGQIVEMRNEGEKIYAIVEFGSDRFAFEPGELKEHAGAAQ